MASQYLPSAEYDCLVSTLQRIATIVPSLRIERSAWTGTVTDDEVKIALGEQLDIWPESICGDVANEQLEPISRGVKSRLLN